MALAGAKHRALLAMLLLHANEVVSTERLIDALWEEERPETAQKALQVYISHLRKTLGKDRVQTKAPGYRVQVAGGRARSRALPATDEGRRSPSSARAVARPAACRVRLRALRPGRDRPPRGAASRLPRAADRARPRRRAPRRARRRARGARRRVPAPRAPPSAADARALPLGEAGRGARYLSGCATRRSSTSSESSPTARSASSNRRS